MLIQDFKGGNLFDFVLDTPGIIGAGVISQQVGQYWVELLAQGQEVDLSMDSTFTDTPYMAGVSSRNLVKGIAPRSSWGPTGDWHLLPSLAAPGAGVMSTFPRSWGGYGILSGTSMAAPYAAGCVALLKQARPGLSAQEIVALLVNTADPAAFSDGTSKPYSFYASVWQQGGGIINPLKALKSAGIPDVSFLSFNDTLATKGGGSVELHNPGPDPIRYEVRTSSAITILTFGNQDDKTLIPWTRVNDSTIASPEFLQTLRPDLAAIIEFNKDHVTLQPGESARIQVTADLTQLQPWQNRCPLYGGYINLQSNTTIPLNIPFGGLACSFQDFKLIETSSKSSYKGVLWITSLSAATKEQALDSKLQLSSIQPNTTFKIPGPNTASHEIGDVSISYPTVVLRLALFTKAVTVDVISLLRIPAANETIGVSETSVFSDSITHRPGGFNRVDSTYLPWNGQLRSGAWVDADTYFFRVCALKSGAGLNVSDAGRECINTVPFNLQYL